MTAGHKHRHLRVREDGWVYRVLRAPLFHTGHIGRAERSRFVYGPCTTDRGAHPCYTLSALGILHPLVGLTLEVSDE